MSNRGAFVLRVRKHHCVNGNRYTAIFDHVLGAYHGNDPEEVVRRAIAMLNSAFTYVAPVVRVVPELA